jgi:hypothetical protein
MAVIYKPHLCGDGRDRPVCVQEQVRGQRKARLLAEPAKGHPNGLAEDPVETGKAQSTGSGGLRHSDVTPGRRVHQRQRWHDLCQPVR